MKLKTKGSFKKGHIVPNEWRNKIRIANIGRTKSDLEILKISKGLKGIKHSKEHNHKISLALKGKPYPRKGMLNKHHTEETIKLISDKNKGKHYSPQTEFKEGCVGFTGKHNEETKLKISEALKGRIAWNKGLKGVLISPMKGKHHSLETIRKIKEWRRTFKLPLKNTAIEKKIQEYLSILHIEYVAHKYISEITHSYQCDIFIMPNIILECDGCYWHGCPICNKKINQWQLKQIEEDKIRTQELIDRGYRIIRLWEHNIKEIELDKFKEIINYV